MLTGAAGEHSGLGVAFGEDGARGGGGTLTHLIEPELESLMLHSTNYM